MVFFITGVSNLKRHSCSRACRDCRDSSCKAGRDEPRTFCQECLRYFGGPGCFTLHKTNGTCQDVKRCPTCRQQLRPPEKHVCGKRQCGFCREMVDKDHLCYIQKQKRPIESEDGDDDDRVSVASKPGPSKRARMSPLYVYFDYEAMQETGIHVPNLVVCQYENNGLKQKIFQMSAELPNPSDAFCQWVFEQHCELPDKNREIILIAHYLKGYDGFFVLDYLFRKLIFPDVIFTGNKPMTISVKPLHIKFIDSFNFLAMGISKFPATFQLKELKKGYFPHLFNTAENLEYVGPFPETRYYSPDTMQTDVRDDFLSWHSHQTEKVFNMQKEIVDYCVSDVQILREGCTKYRELCEQLFQIDPFESTITQAAYCQRVFRERFMPKDSIAIIPQGGYNGRMKQSAKALRWLMWIEHEWRIEIKHARNGGEAKIGPYYVDGVCLETNTVFEFQGCYFHGCLNCYSPDTPNTLRHCTMGDCHATTLDRMMWLREQGYNTVEIWECEYDRQVLQNHGMCEIIKGFDLHDPLNVRDAFFGGRTSATRLYYKVSAGECIRYYDYVSLYPTINKYGRMPIGHPKIIPVPGQYYPGTYFGFVKCTVLPPRDLYLPVLPVRSMNRLLFPICCVCADARQTSICLHSDAERALTGTWITPEVDRAIEKGYKIIKTYEVWHFQEQAEYGKTLKYSKGIMGDYVDALLKIKQEASGWPGHVQTDRDREEFIKQYEVCEGIRLDKNNIVFNPGLRTVSKLMLNSLWGKFGQRENLPKTEYVAKVDRFIELLVSEEHIVTDVNLVNDEMLMVTHKKKDDFIVPSGRTNLFVAAFTTGLARLKLYDLLDRLRQDVLYMDTDSVIFKGRIDHDPLKDMIGDTLGKVTDEIGPGDYISEFVSGGPKNYAYRTVKGKETWKVCGLTQNYRTRQKMDFNTIKAMVTASETVPDEVVIEDTTIVRNKLTAKLETRPSKKTYKINFDKGIVGDDFMVYPYGYVA